MKGEFAGEGPAVRQRRAARGWAAGGWSARAVAGSRNVAKRGDSSPNRHSGKRKGACARRRDCRKRACASRRTIRRWLPTGLQGRSGSRRGCRPSPDHKIHLCQTQLTVFSGGRQYGYQKPATKWERTFNICWGGGLITAPARFYRCCKTTRRGPHRNTS